MLLADIASTGISAAERADVRIGQTVAVFAQGPIGLCATAGARLMGASLVIGVDAIEGRLNLSRQMGADEVIDFTPGGPGRGDQAPDRGTRGRRRDRGDRQAADLSGLPRRHAARRDRLQPRRLRRKARGAARAYVYGIGDKQILTTLCPGGKERMRKLMELVRRGRLDLTPLITHRFALDADRGGLRAVRQPARRRRQGRRSRPDAKEVSMTVRVAINGFGRVGRSAHARRP